MGSALERISTTLNRGWERVEGGREDRGPLSGLRSFGVRLGLAGRRQVVTGPIGAGGAGRGGARARRQATGGAAHTWIANGWCTAGAGAGCRGPSQMLKPTPECTDSWSWQPRLLPAPVESLPTRTQTSAASGEASEAGHRKTSRASTGLRHTTPHDKPHHVTVSWPRLCVRFVRHSALSFLPGVHRARRSVREPAS